MKIITISREFGSGGREIAKRLADLLNFNYYDNEIITSVAKESNLNESYIEEVLEKGAVQNYPVSFYKTFSKNASFNIQVPMLLAISNRFIKKAATMGNCVIVGRGADSILQEYNPLKIFVYSDTKSKIDRCMKFASDGENLSPRESERKIKQIDSGRANIYKLISGMSWGEKSIYDLCINTSHIDIKSISPIIAKYAEEWFKENGK